MVTLAPEVVVGRRRYELSAFLHAGGAGVVWEAIDRRAAEALPNPLTAKCALKILDAGNGGRGTAEAEIETAIRVQHPNVMAVRDSFEEDGRVFIVMDLAKGSLADLVERTGRLRPPEAVSCAIAIAEGLGAAHRTGVVHRDVKPQNVLVKMNGTIVVSDFGSARLHLEGGSNTRTGFGIGTVPYLAPEQRRDARDVRPSTDVYALGVTVAWLLLGVVPDDLWTDDAQEHLKSAGVPAGLVATLAKCGSRKPEDRPENGDAAAKLFLACGVVPAPLTPRLQDWGAREISEPPPTLRTSTGPRPFVVPALLGTAAMAAGVALWLSWPRPAAPDPLTAIPKCTGEEQVWQGDRYPRRNQDAPGLREAGPPAIIDLDGDGFTDVAFPHQLDESLRVFWGEGQRRLGSQFTDIPFDRLSLNSAPATGDIDEDGDIDVLSFNLESASVLVLKNEGNRTFSISPRISHPLTVGRLQLADWDDDGHLDLLVNPPWGESDFTFSWRRGDGHGNFASEQPLRLGQAVVLEPSAAFVWAVSPDEVLRIPIKKGRPAVENSMTTVVSFPLDSLSGLDWPLVGLVRKGDETIPIWFRADQPPCQLPEVGSMGLPSFGDLNGDGRLDAAWSTTCPYCTSAYFATFG